MNLLAAPSTVKTSARITGLARCCSFLRGCAGYGSGSERGQSPEAQGIGSTRCARLAGAAYGSGQNSVRCVILPSLTVKNETARAD